MHICWLAGHFVEEYTPSEYACRGANASFSVIRLLASRRKTAPTSRGVAQSEAADQDRAVLGDDRAQGLPMLGRPARRVPAGLGPQHGWFAGLQLDLEQSTLRIRWTSRFLLGCQFTRKPAVRRSAARPARLRPDGCAGSSGRRRRVRAGRRGRPGAASRGSAAGTPPCSGRPRQRPR